MKRIILSILTGIFFPILYVIVTISLGELLFPYQHLDTMYVYNGQPTLGLILAPVALPFWLYDFIKFHQHFGYGIYLNTLWFRLLLIVGFNFTLYTGLSYLLFSYLGWFGSIKAVKFQEPPNPSMF